jgi:outer membrane protein assembly factor BamD (BamD/ComL family)
MRNTFLILILAVIFSCAEAQMSPAGTAELVVESFYQKQNSELKKYTTSESYESFLSVQELFTQENNVKESNFKLIRDSIIGNNAWVTPLLKV